MKALALLCLAALCSCGVTGPRHVRTGGAVGASFGNIGSLDATGVYGSGRFEVSNAVSYDNDQIEIGGRFLVGGRGYDLDDGVTTGNTSVDNANFDTSIEAVMRFYLNNRHSNIRPYLEGFAGFGLQRFDFELSNPAASASFDEVGYGSTIGGAAGLEFPLADGFTFAFGAEVRYVSYEFDDFAGLGAGDLQTDAVDVGGFAMFGLRL